MIRLSPSVRISIGLVFITISLLLLGSFAGLIPDKVLLATEARKNIAESLAAQSTLAARYNSVAALRETMDTMLALHDDLISMGIRNAQGRYIAQTSEHKVLWIPPEGDESTSTHWQVPLYRRGQKWGTMEISFSPHDSITFLGYRLSPFVMLLTFVSFLSFIAFFIYMKRMLRHLDPTTVMPKRVKDAFDTLTEGVIIMDAKGRIILANKAFADKLACSVEALMGLNASQLEWISQETKPPFRPAPWIDVMSSGQSRAGIPLHIARNANDIVSFMANISPILDDEGEGRGALVTFDDVTELEKKNKQLSKMLEMLQESNYKIEVQNQELEALAKVDSLTGCLNRRSFFELAEHHLAQAAAEGGHLSCIMLDIDLFKSINDTHGHAVGDQALQYFAQNLKSKVRSDDAVCRYGGEEFCLLLPKCDLEKAAKIAEGIRVSIASQPLQVNDGTEIHVTASLGVSEMLNGSEAFEDILGRADRAVYSAKDWGRNRVVVWDLTKETEFLQQAEERRAQASSFNA